MQVDQGPFLMSRSRLVGLTKIFRPNIKDDNSDKVASCQQGYVSEKGVSRVESNLSLNRPRKFFSRLESQDWFISNSDVEAILHFWSTLSLAKLSQGNRKVFSGAVQRTEHFISVFYGSYIRLLYDKYKRRRLCLQRCLESCNICHHLRIIFSYC